MTMSCLCRWCAPVFCVWLIEFHSFELLILLSNSSNLVVDGMVLAASADHHVPAGIVVHHRGAWLQYDDILQQGGTTRTNNPHRQNCYRRCKKKRVEFSFFFSIKTFCILN
jgi:hypothetical protein